MLLSLPGFEVAQMESAAGFVAPFMVVIVMAVVLVTEESHTNFGAIMTAGAVMVMKLHDTRRQHYQ